MKPYLYGAAGGLLIGLIAGWYMRTPQVKIEERIVTKTETKWRTNERIVTLPGATVYRDREGNTTITGPVEITSSRSGEGIITNDINHKSESCPPPVGRVLSGGFTMDLSGNKWGAAQGTFRALGPVYATLGCQVPTTLKWEDTMFTGMLGWGF